MYRTSFDPFSECWEMFRSLMFGGCSSGRRFYTRQEQLEELENLKKKLQREIAGIDERIQDLKAQQAR
ncbi:MAG: hypothetical protein HYX74_05265 [Acidobacteria bacterium]|nr:hypothetical protein [Acidobacteriota bacterium]